MAFNKNTVSPFMVGTMRLGMWGAKLGTDELAAFTEKCLAMGLKDFDFADIYGDYTTEADFGILFKQKPSLRDSMRITTKCGIKMLAESRPDHRTKSYDLSASHIKASVEKSLSNLNTDHIDVLLLHRPDYLIDPHEVAEIFMTLKQEGKVLEFGVSNFTTSQFELLHSFTPLVTNQIEISLLHRDAFHDGTLDQCIKHNIVPTAWSPLGGGAIFSDSKEPRIQAIKDAGQILGKKYGLTLDQILLVWLLKHPAGIIPVLGTSKTDRIASAAKALDINLTHEEWYILWKAATGKEIA